MPKLVGRESEYELVDEQRERIRCWFGYEMTKKHRRWLTRCTPFLDVAMNPNEMLKCHKVLCFKD